MDSSLLAVLAVLIIPESDLCSPASYVAEGRSIMKMKWMTLATLALALSPALALAAPGKGTHSTGTGRANQYHDRTPRIHERGSASVR